MSPLKWLSFHAKYAATGTANSIIGRQWMRTVRGIVPSQEPNPKTTASSPPSGRVRATSAASA